MTFDKLGMTFYFILFYLVTALPQIIIADKVLPRVKIVDTALLMVKIVDAALPWIRIVDINLPQVRIVDTSLPSKNNGYDPTTSNLVTYNPNYGNNSGIGQIK